MSTIPATDGTDKEPIGQILIPSYLGEKHTSVNWMVLITLLNVYNFKMKKYKVLQQKINE